MVELCSKIESGQSCDHINNLWVKKRMEQLFNPTRMVDMDRNPLIDMSLFEEARFYRPMGGQVYRMFPVETHRGCPYECAFCNSAQQELYKLEKVNHICAENPLKIYERNFFSTKKK